MLLRDVARLSALRRIPHILFGSGWGAPPERQFSPFLYFFSIFLISSNPQYGTSAAGIFIEPSVLLEVLDDGDEAAAAGDGGAVEHVDELVLSRPRP